MRVDCEERAFVWLQRAVFFACLTGAIGFSLACAPAPGTLTTTTTTQTDYKIRQNAYTADPAPRAVGELVPEGKWAVEVGYDRTFVRIGPSRDAGGSGQSPTLDTGHVRAARAVGNEGEIGFFGQLSLSHKPGAADMAPTDFVANAWLTGFTARIRPRLNDVVAFVGGFQAAVGALPWQRDIQAVTTIHTEWTPVGTTTPARSSTSVDKQAYATSGSALAGSAHVSLGLEFRLAQQISLQVGAAGGVVSAVMGVVTTATRCSSTYTTPYGATSGSCIGQTPDELGVAHAESFVMPTAALTATFLPLQFVLSGWWLAATTGNLQDVTPGGLMLAARVIL